MSKELEALNKLFVLSSEYHQKLWCLKLAPVYPEAREKYIDRIVKCLPNDGGELNDLYNYIKQALKRNEPIEVLEKQKVSCGLSIILNGICPKCHHQIHNNQKFCDECGQKLVWSSDK